jgi:vacuolar-type H+-ATPase subunit E/Vma4
MALVDIIALIESKAAEQATDLLEKAKKEVEALQKESESSTEETVALLKKEGEDERRAMEKQSTSQVNREDRMIISAAQQEMVDKTFSEVDSLLQSLSGDELVEIFSTLLSRISTEKGEVVVLGSRKSEMEKALSSVGKSFSVSEDSDSSQGGFIFKGEDFDMDFSFSAIVEKELRPSQEGKVFSELF